MEQLKRENVDGVRPKQKHTHIRRRLTLNITQTTQNVNKGFQVGVDQLSFDLNTFERVIITLLDRIEIVVILAGKKRCSPASRVRARVLPSATNRRR